MQKIATVTLDGYFNYGNVLQRYALCKLLADFGNTVVSLWCTDEVMQLGYWEQKYLWMKSPRSLKTNIKLGINWKGITSNMLSGKNAWEAARTTLIKSFCDRYIPIRYHADFDRIAEEYDCFITGSDQVWNPHFADLDKMFLKFVPQEKRVAYAASISCPEIPQEIRNDFIDGIKGMQAISVREQAGADLIETLTGREVEVVADPTMLVAADDWRKIARKPSWLNGGEKLLVTYFLGKRPDSVIEKTAKENNLQVINILDERIFEHYAIAPEEWLWLIDHAAFMYTDSFHGTVFSILFRTPFVVTERVGEGCTSKMTSRIDTLLEKFGLTDRRGTAGNGYMVLNPLHVEYGDVDHVLGQEKVKTHKYLERALNG